MIIIFKQRQSVEKLCQRVKKVTKEKNAVKKCHYFICPRNSWIHTKQTFPIFQAEFYYQEMKRADVLPQLTAKIFSSIDWNAVYQPGRASTAKQFLCQCVENMKFRFSWRKAGDASGLISELSVEITRAPRHQLKSWPWCSEDMRVQPTCLSFTSRSQKKLHTSSLLSLPHFKRDKTISHVCSDCRPTLPFRSTSVSAHHRSLYTVSTDLVLGGRWWLMGRQMPLILSLFVQPKKL